MVLSKLCKVVRVMHFSSQNFTKLYLQIEKQKKHKIFFFSFNDVRALCMELSLAALGVYPLNINHYKASVHTSRNKTFSIFIIEKYLYRE